MSRTLQPDDQISHYRVVGPLGAGGMGEVYIAQDEKLERSVALKVLPLRLVRNEERVRRFVTEAKSASSLNHPNIVTIYEIGHDVVRSSRAGDGAEPDAEPVHFISMELVSGDTLTQKIHHEKADLRTLLGYLAQAAEGVSKAHAAGIVHRDLKPGNIMVSKDGFAKVLDFGLAKLTEKQAPAEADATSAPTNVAATSEGVVMGTVGYMSPEQVQAKTVDHRSDIFSMGCILYEAATRRRPFVADTDIEVMHQILREKPRAIEELNPEVPAEVRRIVRRCLAKSPDQRFQSMRDVAIDLREVVEEWDTLSASATSATSAPSVPSGALGAAPGRGKGFWIGMTAAAVVALGGLAFGLYGLLGRGARGEDAGAGFQDLKMSVLMSRNDLGEAVLSKDGRYLAYVTAKDRETSFVVRQVRTGSDAPILPDQDFQIRGISFSPDGDYLYYLNRDPDAAHYSALWEVPSLGGSPRKVAFDVDSAATFSPDGKRACFRRGLLDVSQDSLVVAEVDSGKERELVRIKSPEHFIVPPARSPDGKKIAAGIQSTEAGAKTWMVAIDAETGTSERFGNRTWLSANSTGWVPDGGAVVVSAFDLGAGTSPQLYRVSYPGGKTLRVTNDLDGYGNLSISADGSSIAAIRRTTVDNLWVARTEKGAEAQPITFASGSAGSIGNLVPLPHGAAAFSAPKDNSVFMWRIGADGNGRRQLSSQGIFVINAEYTEGTGLVFSQVDAGEKVVAHVWRMDADGGGLKQLTEGNGEQLIALSPAGNALAFSRWDDPKSIWIRNIGEARPYKLVDGKAVELPLVSHDGKRALYATLEEVQGKFLTRYHVVPLPGGEPQAGFSLPPGATNLLWTPDGAALTFVDRGQGWNLMRKTIPDGEPQPLTRFTDGQVVDHVWHPDGSRMVIHRRVDQKDSLWVLKPGEAQPTLVTEFKTGRLSRHFWAPDEPLLYFTYGASTQDVVLIGGFK